MRLLAASLIFTFASLVVAARDLSIVSRENQKVIIKSKGDANTLWFSVSIKDGIPFFEIKGNEKDDEKAAKASVQLAMDRFGEVGIQSGGVKLAGTLAFWTDINVERVEEGKRIKKVILQSTMTHQEKDISGNFFTVALEAVIDENSESFTIRPMVQNYPYAKTDGKGILTFDQLIGTSGKSEVKLDSYGNVTLGNFGSLQVLTESAIEDGNPGTINSQKIERLKAPSQKLALMNESSGLSKLQFDTIRPKNATFLEILVFNPQGLKLASTAPDLEEESALVKSKEESNDKVKGMIINGGASTGRFSFSSLNVVGISTLALVAVGLLA